MSEKYQGHMTLADGRRVQLSEQECADLWAESERLMAEDAEAMPDTATALAARQRACGRLERLGWREGTGCPKDGTPFAVITPGSTGIHIASYSGEWPDGYLMVAGCVNRPNGCLWKALDDLTDDERVKMDECTELHRQLMEREFRAFGANEQSEEKS